MLASSGAIAQPPVAEFPGVAGDRTASGTTAVHSSSGLGLALKRKNRQVESLLVADYCIRTGLGPAAQVMELDRGRLARGPCSVDGF